ncbi:MAG TPA: hypothetical protein DCL54_05480 [Alphaproteobacteria bacterium]|nr:hypothetical protein [Alphaproteobacteria bacterium]HAJ46014.1 hypothetical protein [Alphaproteobacteria bacterium]
MFNTNALVAVSDEATANAIIAFLESVGLRPHWALDAGAAEEVLKRQAFGLFVVSDELAGGGLHLIPKFRGWGKGLAGQAQAIVVTSHDCQALESAAQSLQVCGVLRQPVQTKMLAELVQKALLAASAFAGE